MINSKEFIATDSIRLVNDANKNLLGTITIDSSGQLVFTDEFTINTYKFDKSDEKIGSLTIKDISEFPQGVTVTDNGQILFQDTSASVFLNNIVSEVDIIQLLDKLNTVGSIYDIKVKQMTFGDYKYANVKLCTDIANTFGYFSVDKLLNDERARQLFQNEQAAIYKGTIQEALYPPYGGFLRDQNYQVNGWISIDHLIHAALGNDFAYDDAASFSIRTKPFQDAKRVIIMMVLNYVNDMFSLGSFNKLADFGVRIVDRNTDQEVDLSCVHTNIIGEIGSNILATYVGPLKYNLTKTFPLSVPHISDLNVNKCDKKYINKCDGVIITLKDEPATLDDGCPTCFRHELGVEIRVNPHADTRINKLDIQNTVDPIHWTAGLLTETCDISANRKIVTQKNSFSLFNDLITEFGEKSYTVGRLNESRAFAGADGSVNSGIVAGGFMHDENSDAIQRDSTEIWNGTSWCLAEGRMPVGRSLGLMNGDANQAAYAFGASVNFTSPPYDEFGKAYNPSSVNLHFENDTILWNGNAWFVPSPYTLPTPNIPRHSVAGKLSVKITTTDENKNPIIARDSFKPHTVLEDNFLMKDEDFFKLTSVQNPDATTNWFSLVRYSGIAFGGTTDSTLNLTSIPEISVRNDFEYVAWGSMLRFITSTEVTSAGGISSHNSIDISAGTWLVDPTRHYPINAYGISYVGNTVRGLATGGKTGKSPNSLITVYTDPNNFSEFDAPVSNLAYEYNGITWIRRDNLPEAVYYHSGVGDLDYSIFWGGLHGSLEDPHIYDSTETFEDWEVVVSRFGGSIHRNGTIGINGELRYSLFPTLFEDSNKWFQLGDSRDYISGGKTLLCTTAISGIYAGFNPSLVNGTIANKHNIQISKIIDDSTINVTTYYDGESWKSNKIRAGDKKWKAFGESHDQVSAFTYANENDIIESFNGIYIKNPDGSTSNSVVPNGVFAPRFNILNSLNSDYSGHTIRGGMWLWSRPTVGENVFHPDNFLTPPGTDVNNPVVVREIVKHSFIPTALGPITGDSTLFSFFIEYDTDHVNGLELFVWEKKINENEFAFVETWDMPASAQVYFTNNSIISGYNLKVNDQIIKATDFPYRNTVSYAKFITPLSDLIEVDTLTGLSEINKFITMQSRTTDIDISANSFIYDLSYFNSWVVDTSGKNFHPINYDSFTQFFVENDGFKLTTGNYLKSSTIRDKAALFPWCDLLHGDATKRARLGDVTWNWIREPITEHDVIVYRTYLIVAETIFANFIVPGTYFDPDGSVKITDTKFWREVFKISKFDKNGNELWSYQITYDEAPTMSFDEPEYYISDTYPLIGTLFGTALNDRVMNDGISTNRTVDISGNVTLRTIELWNSKTINAATETIDVKANEQFDMTYIDWKKMVDNNLPLFMYYERRKTLNDMLDDEYKIPSSAISILSSVPFADAWFLSMPGSAFNGMIIADSKLTIQQNTRTIETSAGDFITYNDISKYVPKAGPGLVKEYISSYNWGSDISGWKITKAFLASDISSGYISKDYGKSTFNIPPVTIAPISANPDYAYIQNNAQYAFPWNYLIQNPAMYVEMVDLSGGFWFAYGDTTNKALTGANDTQINVYRIGHIPDSKFNNLRLSPLGKTVYDNIINVRLYGSSNQYRHKDSLLELVNNKNGHELFDVFVTLVEENGDKPFGDDVPYHAPLPPPPISAGPQPFEPPIPYLFCCSVITTGGVITEVTSSCKIQLISNSFISEGDGNCLECYINNTDTTNFPEWEQHNHEEWNIPFIESPFAGPFANDDFNIWISTAKSDQVRWGALIFNNIPQNGQLLATFKAHRIGIDVPNNKVYLCILTASIGIETFNEVESGNVNIPCRIIYDEFIFPTQFSTDSVDATGYATLPYIENIRKQNEEFKKDPGVFCTEPVFVYIPEVSGCDVSASKYYAEWGTNFIQEFKNKVTDPTDPVEHKYFFVHDNVPKYGSSTNGHLPDPTSYRIIETDWRRYQDGAGLGGDIPDTDSNACLPLKKWFIGHSAFGTPDKAIIVGGYSIKSGENTLPTNANDSWWNLFTTTKTFKWNKNIINPEDMYNKNYTKRNFSPFFTNGENTYSNSSLSYIMFDIGKNANVERRGTIDFNGDGNSVEVVFNEPIPEIFTTRDAYSITMTPNDNIKLWWNNKIETGFTIVSEINNWVGKVDWSIFYTENLGKDSVEGNLGEQDTYDKFKNF